MFKKQSTLLVFIAITALFFSNYAFDTAQLEARSGQQTIPTRTPVPAPTEDNNNNNDNNNDNNNGDGGNPAPTNTATPANTPTATAIPVKIGPTPEGGHFQPEACGPPYFQSSQGSSNVRSMPSTDGEVLAQMVYLEARLIIGRATADEWWYVSLPNGINGWTANVAGTVIGNTDSVPVLNNDGTPATSGSTWNPTPNPSCPTSTPSPTPIPATETPVPVNTATAAPTEPVEPTNTAAPTETPAPTDSPTNTPEPTETAVPVEAADEAEMAVADTSATETDETATDEATTDEVASTETAPPEEEGGVNWVTVAGAALIALGGGAFFFQRRQGSA